tara:strand:- start:99 stop:566 length:468 start_codon:yes stop_codon:yes gene_type:complete
MTVNCVMVAIDVLMEKLKFLVKYALLIHSVNIIKEKLYVKYVKVIHYVTIIHLNIFVKYVKEVLYVFIIKEKMNVDYVTVLVFVIIIKKKVNVEYVLLIIIHFVFIVNIFGVLRDIYLQKIHMKNFVLIVTIIYIQMKKKYQLNIRKNNIIFMRN